MRLLEAFQLLNQPDSAEPRFRLLLATGFTPLHLGTLLRAHLKQRFGNRGIDLSGGLYGDLAGTLRRAADEASGWDGIAAVIEWADLDPRLGVRQLGGWGPETVDDILATCRNQSQRFQSVLADAAGKAPLVVSLPTLPLPPVSHEASWQGGSAEWTFRVIVAELGAGLSRIPGLRLISPQELDRLSPPAERFDIAAELNSGFPYTLQHADIVSQLLAQGLHNRPPKKGLITDLDDTFWSGILGEEGIQGVSWTLEKKTQLHGIYQQWLRAAAAAGVLVGVASKNDPLLVDQCFSERTDLLAPASVLFPIHAGWGPKSEAIDRILQTWNIAADSVVFIDDSPMELEEVRRQHPGIETFTFPSKNPAELWTLLNTLQDLFGKPGLQEEDQLRRESLRTAAAFAESAEAGGETDEAFLQQLNAVVTLAPAHPDDARPLELINKTNQFNLNGRRITEAAWKAHLNDPGGFTLVISYQDKFGPLGKVAVIAGRLEDRGTEKVVRISSWVMSCRAFARRLEHQCLEQVFALTGCDCLELEFEPTQRNGPLRDFLDVVHEELMEDAGILRLERSQVSGKLPALYHQIDAAQPEPASKGPEQ